MKMMVAAITAYKYPLVLYKELRQYTELWEIEQEVYQHEKLTRTPLCNFSRRWLTV